MKKAFTAALTAAVLLIPTAAFAAPGDNGKACERGFNNALINNPGDAEGWENMNEDARTKLAARYVAACVL